MKSPSWWRRRLRSGRRTNPGKHRATPPATRTPAQAVTRWRDHRSPACTFPLICFYNSLDRCFPRPAVWQTLCKLLTPQRQFKQTHPPKLRCGPVGRQTFALRPDAVHAEAAHARGSPKVKPGTEGQASEGSHRGQSRDTGACRVSPRVWAACGKMSDRMHRGTVDFVSLLWFFSTLTPSSSQRLCLSLTAST